VECIDDYTVLSVYNDYQNLFLCLHNRCRMIETACCVCLFRGRTPAEAELMYLENAKKLEMYGIHLQQAKVLTLTLNLSLT